MANIKVKQKEQKATLAALKPSIGVTENDISREEVRLAFATAVTTGLVREHGDLGGRDDERIVKGVFRLADLLTDAYFNT